MITKLPVVINNRIEYINFKIKKNASELHIELIDNIDTIKNNNFITIVCHNKYNCLYYFKISLPLNILIIDNNKLLSVFFFTLACNSQIRNKLDFFSVLIDNINSNKEIKGKKFSIIKLSDLSNYELHIWKDINLLNNNFNKIKKFNNVIDFLKKLYNYLYLYINLALFLIYLYPDYTNRSIKSVNNYTLIDNKVISLANIIKNIKFSYKYSNKFTIIEHINNISNDIKKISDIKVGKKYFLEINKNKWIKIDVQRLDNNIIKHYAVF